MSQIDDAIKKINEIVDDIQDFAEAKYAGLDEQTRNKIEAVVDKTKNTVLQAKDKVVETVNKVQDEEKVTEFLQKVVAKVQEAADFTKMKVSEIVPESDKLENVERQISESFDKIMDNENVRGAVKSVQNLGDTISDFLNKPEVKSKINSAKKWTLNVAEKGLDRLKVILNVDDDAETVVIEDEVEKKEDKAE